MFIRNIEKISDENLFFCKSIKLKKFLTENYKISYSGKKEEGSRITWIFLKTPILDIALTEWKNNKILGILAIK